MPDKKRPEVDRPVERPESVERPSDFAEDLEKRSDVTYERGISDSYSPPQIDDTIDPPDPPPANENEE